MQREVVVVDMISMVAMAVVVVVVVVVAMVAVVAVVPTQRIAKVTKRRRIRVPSNVEWGPVWMCPVGRFSFSPIHGLQLSSWCCKEVVPIANSFRAWCSHMASLLASMPLSWWRLGKPHPFHATSLRQHDLSTLCVWMMS